MKSLLTSVVSLVLMMSAHAQHTSIPQAIVFTVGTTARDAGGQDWAFLLWEAPVADVLGGRSFAVYGKAGTASAPATYAREGIVQGARYDPTLIATLLQRAALVGQDLEQFDKVMDGIYAGAFQPNAAPALPADRAQRTATALSKASTSRNQIGTVRKLAMMNPTLALCLGQAWIGPMPIGATKTYELREWNDGSDGAVVGRVTLTGGAPVLLPSTARPVQVTDTSEAADLAVRLRWGVPDVLKRRIMLHQGYRVWRMSWAQAQALGYDTTPPTLAQLQAHAINGQARLITSVPLFLPAPMSSAEAEDPWFLPNRSYLTDDYGRQDDPQHYVAPADGLEAAYIVTARDVLGRNGAPSLAGRGQFVANKRPPVPRHASVEIVYGNADANGAQPQSFKFSFDENEANPGNPTTGYEIYRGTDDIADAPVNFLNLLQHNGTGRRETMQSTPAFAADTQVWFCVRALRVGPAGIIRSDFSPPVFAALQSQQGPPAPQPVAAGNLCPQPGVITAFNNIVANEAVAVNRFFHFRMVCDRLDQQMQWAQFKYVTDAGGAHEATHDVGRIDFSGNDRVRYDFVLNEADIASTTHFLCTTSDSDGGVQTATAMAVRNGGVMNLNAVYEVQFLTSMVNPVSLEEGNAVADSFLDRDQTLVADEVSFTPGTRRGVAHVADVNLSAGYLVERKLNSVWTRAGFGTRADGTHLVFNDTTTADVSTVGEDYRFIALVNLNACDDTKLAVIGTTANGKAAKVRVCMTAPAPDTALEYRFYRRVDDGPLVLMAEGRPPEGVGASVICEEDTGLSITGGTANYYGQFIGRNGAASPLALVKGVRVEAAVLPRVAHASPEIAGDANNPQVRLHWSCPVDGVDRFQITLRRLASNTVSSGVASHYQQVQRLRTPPANSLLMNFVPPEPVTSIITNRIGSTQLGDGPAFALDAEVDRDVTYEIWINALSPSGKVGPDSAVQTFEWKAPPAIEDDNVPWPFRELPEVIADEFPAHSINGALKLWPFDQPCVGGRVGTFPSGWATPQYPFAFVGQLSNPTALGLPLDDSIHTRLALGVNRYLSRMNNKPVLPAVLYRQQLSNAEWPVVSGDVVQVSPLISTVLCTDDPHADYQALLRDPFFGVAMHLDAPAFGQPIDNPVLTLGLYLLDTTPRAVGAKYRYWLVRFDEITGAPAFVIPATLGEVTP